MAEYIERETLISELSASCMPIDDREISGLLGCNESIRDVINAMPSADARPERHGKWEKSCDGYSYFCSICKEEPDRSGRLLSDFCPWCGAKMDRIGD